MIVYYSSSSTVYSILPVLVTTLIPVIHCALHLMVFSIYGLYSFRLINYCYSFAKDQRRWLEPSRVPMTRIHQVIELLLWLILFIPRLRLSPDEVPPLFPLPPFIPIDFDSGTLYIYIMYVLY